MLRMVKNSGLKNGCQIRCGHLVEVRLARKDCKKIQDIEQELAIEWRKLSDQALVSLDSCFYIEVT